MRNSLLPLAGVLSLLSFCPDGQAQLAPSNRLVGWVHPGGSAKSGRIETQDADASCQSAKALCNGVLWPAATNGGGSAYDPRHFSLWSSDGQRLEEWLLGSCKKLCTVKPMIQYRGSYITGLAMADEERILWQLESQPGAYGLLPYDARKCPPVPLRGGCVQKLSNPRGIAGGLAYDEVRKLLYYAISEPGFTGYISTLYVAPAAMGKACAPICKLSLKSCRVGWGAITGLAYDSCTQRLYITDGTETKILLAINPAKCQWKDLSCCKKQSSGRWMGLAVIPGWSQSAKGKPCIGKGCAFCPKLDLRLVGGDPSLGNRDFGIAVTGGPLNSFGLLVLGSGPCTQGLRLPFFCGALYPALAPLPPLLFPAAALTGSTQCSGSTTVPLPVPVIPSLCRQSFCAQWLVFCGSTSASGLSQAVQFQFTGS